MEADHTFAFQNAQPEAFALVAGLGHQGRFRLRRREEAVDGEMEPAVLGRPQSWNLVDSPGRGASIGQGMFAVLLSANEQCGVARLMASSTAKQQTCDVG